MNRKSYATSERLWPQYRTLFHLYTVRFRPKTKFENTVNRKSYATSERLWPQYRTLLSPLRFELLANESRDLSQAGVRAE